MHMDTTENIKQQSNPQQLLFEVIAIVLNQPTSSSVTLTQPTLASGPQTQSIEELYDFRHLLLLLLEIQKIIHANSIVEHVKSLIEV
ncbi:hypothetical protein NC651_017574 [Populus alba x Populus x berolinensis]|uniref:Uncharacterized protein n=1 Tax=Populus alba x Populus x berolinensis TaxID=444605 RepID=A0AAD6VUL7_9ROSI|nr:hypothetical protein NC651_017553 [Populus alba x Populus x berolinensis]KAJ6906925.1 hypothetical protein NC651_017558 [Populus alba x Populus x berolinensis]KAJ6906938.1 hypothetical protein NC651_017570 [Populus alba x Populus x berolinensis]KAJ6906942.1 hypothetical protein NC651_017574 [Populus alba x Populus x berolinensis]KAJ6989655.1 hypothetical protein NC653_018213 [Populus alba x Populus x berolinensis]